jgi:ribonucleoside-diphosphate reductase alpha chain
MEKLPRPKEVTAAIRKAKLVCGNAYITVSFLDNKVFEVFATIGKSGGCVTCMLQALTTSITLGIRHGIPVEEYIKHLVGYACPSISWEDGVKYLSCVDAVGRIMKEQNDKLREIKK